MLKNDYLLCSLLGMGSCCCHSADRNLLSEGTKAARKEAWEQSQEGKS